MLFRAVRHIWFGVIPFAQKFKHRYLHIICTDDDIGLNMLVSPGRIWAGPLLRKTTCWWCLLYMDQSGWFSFSLSSRADADGFFRNQCWHNTGYFIYLLPWLISFLWDRLNMRIMVKIGSLVNVGRPLWILMLPEGLIDGIVDGLTMLFETIRPFGYAAPSTENICPSLWAINGK